MLTDNHILVDRLIEEPVLMCLQKKAAKKIPTVEDTVQANIESFGNDIGKITNRCTTMYELRSHFKPEDEEYKVLTYRIQSCQQIQQDTIDKAKGIISKPMPRTWYDRHAVNQLEDEKEKRFQRSIVAERKPYFMRYIYPDLMRQYNTYIDSTMKSSLREFGMTVEEMQAVPYGNLTDRQKEYLHYYEIHKPVGEGNCTMNKICWLFEDAFDGYISRKAMKGDFDCSIYKSDCEYQLNQYNTINRLFKEYQGRLQNYMIFSKYERVDADDVLTVISAYQEEFIRNCDSVCQNESELCNIMIDICYKQSSTKHVVWDLFGDVIIKNLLDRSGNRISAPMRDDNGDIEFGGERFSVVTMEIDDGGDL